MSESTHVGDNYGNGRGFRGKKFIVKKFYCTICKEMKFGVPESEKGECKKCLKK